MDKQVRKLLAAVTPAQRRRDAETMLDLMGRVTGEKPVVDRSMVRYGTYHYKYESGREGDCAAAGFAPRKAALVVYLMDGVGAHEKALAKLGPHTSTVGCLYIKDLEQCDLVVLEKIIAKSYKTLTAGTYGLRARDGNKT